MTNASGESSLFFPLLTPSFSPSSLLAGYCNVVITLSLRFMERLTLAVMFLKSVGEEGRLVFHSMASFNAATDTLLVEIALTQQY